MVRGLAGARQAHGLRAERSSQSGGQIRLHLLPLRLLDVILRGVFKMRLNLQTDREEIITQDEEVPCNTFKSLIHSFLVNSSKN